VTVAAWLRLHLTGPSRSAIQGKLAVLSLEKKVRFLDCESQGRQVHAPLLNEIRGTFAGEELIVLDRDCDIPFHSLNFMRFHSTPELLNQSTAPTPEFAGIRGELPLLCRLCSRTDQIDEAPPGDLGDETALVSGHALIHLFLSKLLCSLDALLM
jgi:hypothetical protein